MNRLTTTKKTVYIGAKITPQEKEVFVAAADKLGLNISQLVVEALYEYIQNRRMED